MPTVAMIEWFQTCFSLAGRQTANESAPHATVLSRSQTWMGTWWLNSARCCRQRIASILRRARIGPEPIFDRSLAAECLTKNVSREHRSSASAKAARSHRMDDFMVHCEIVQARFFSASMDNECRSKSLSPTGFREQCGQLTDVTFG